MTTPAPKFTPRSRLIRPNTGDSMERAGQLGHIDLKWASREPYPHWKMPEQWPAEIRMFGVWDASGDQSWGIGWHVNEGIEITYLERGTLHFEVEGAGPAVLLKEGDMTITLPWQKHRVGGPDITASRLHWLIFNVDAERPAEEFHWPKWLLNRKEELNHLTKLLKQNNHPVWRANPEVQHTFQRLSALLIEKRNDADVWIKLHVNEIVMTLTEFLTNSPSQPESGNKRSQRAVEKFLAELPGKISEEWTVDTMAAQCGLNHTRFAHHCKQITNKTPAAYLAECRVEAAARLLRSSDNLSVTDIAYACGFGSSQYFATVFRQHTGLTPREFREQKHP